MKSEDMRDAIVAQIPPAAGERVMRRDAVAREVCREKGWDFDSLTLEQVLTIREDPRWRAA